MQIEQSPVYGIRITFEDETEQNTLMALMEAVGYSVATLKSHDYSSFNDEIKPMARRIFLNLEFGDPV